MSTPLSRVLPELGGLPELRQVFDRCLAVLAAGPEVSLAVAGSLAAGEVDEFSDLDLIALVDDGGDAGALRERLLEALHPEAEVLASFEATHLGRPDLWIVYLRWGDWVVKLDLALQHRPSALPLPIEARILHDPAGRFAGLPREQGAGALDFAQIDRRFVGWLWYTYSKIERGELFQAARSIDYTRENALLPGLLFLHDQPQDGHRRVERRLPAEEVARLARSYPAALEKGELLRAFRSLAEHYQTARSALIVKLGRDVGGADLASMMEVIDLAAAPDTVGAGEPWYVRYYGEDYARSVADLLTPERSAAEVEFILALTGVTPPTAFADLGCGDGRHSRLLAQRGFAVTAVDLNPEFIARGRALADPQRPPRFEVGDLRRALPGPYDVILSLFNSWGFTTDADDEATLAGWTARLRPGGCWVFDLWNRDALVRRFQPDRRRVISDELTVVETARFDPLSGRLHRTYEYRYSDGRTHRHPASFRLYAPAELRTLLARHGLRIEALYGSLTGGDYSWDSPRLVALVRKPK